MGNDIHNGIKIEPFHLYSLEELVIRHEINEHSQVFIKGKLFTGEGEKEEKYVTENFADELLVVKQVTEGSREEILFCGKVIDIKVNYNSRMYDIEIKALSCSCELDIRRNKRSFQKLANNVMNIIERVVSDVNGAVCDKGEFEGYLVQELLVQYHETDWEFLKRLASQEPFYTFVAPDPLKNKPAFWLGIPRGNDYTEEDLRVVFQNEDAPSFYRKSKKIAVYRDAKANFYKEMDADEDSKSKTDKMQEKQYVCYEVKTLKNVKVGDSVKIGGQKFIIFKSTATIQRGLLYHDCQMMPPEGLQQKTVYNDQLLGMALEGKVIQCKNDHLKVNLDIDQQSYLNPDDARDLPYSPFYAATNQTGWYCMPEVGDRVKVYFPTCRERNAIVINSVRKSETDLVKDPDHIYFQTKDQKRLHFDRNALAISGKDKKVRIKINAQSGIEIHSETDLKIHAKEKLKMEANVISFVAANKLEVKCQQSSLQMDKATSQPVLSSKRIIKRSGRPVFNGQKEFYFGKGGQLAQVEIGSQNFGDFKAVNGTQCFGGDPVNVANGNFYDNLLDMEIQGGFPLELRRHYNSGDSSQGILGRTWHCSFAMGLAVADGSVRITFEDGHTEQFTAETDSRYAAVDINSGRLVKNAGIYQLTRMDGAIYLFDSQGRLTELQNPYGNKIVYRYEEQRLVEVANPGGSFRFEYDAAGLLTQVSDMTGRSVAYSYSAGLLTAFMDVDGHTYRYEYDESGRVAALIDPLGNVTLQNRYDAKGRVVEQVTADGSHSTFAYDDRELLTQFIERNGAEYLYTKDHKDRICEKDYPEGHEKLVFNDRDQLVEFVDQNGNPTRYEYDAAGNIAKEIDALGNITEYSYDHNHNMTLVKQPDGSLYRYQYDAKGKLLSAIDPLGRELKLEYNKAGLPVNTVLPGGARFQVAYDTKGNAVNICDPEGGQTRLDYDVLNRVRTIVRPVGNQITLEYLPSGKLSKVAYPDGTNLTAQYNPCGWLVEQTDEAGAVTQYQYNQLGKVSAIIDPLGGTTKFKYDKMANITQITKPDGSTLGYSYNAANLLKSVVDEEGFTRTFEYDPNDNLVKATDAKGGLTVLNYDALDRVVELIDAREAVTRYEYRFDGKITKVTNALKGVAQYTYDRAGQLTSYTDFGGGVKKFTYNPLGLVETFTDPLGGVTRFAYNGNGKVVKVTQPDGAIEQLEYDKNGNLTKHLDPKGNPTTFAYDCRDRLTSITNALGGVKRVEYTPTGKPAAIVDESGNPSQFKYDPLNRLIEILDAQGNKTRYRYDAVGNLTEVHQYAGVQPEVLAGMRQDRGVAPTAALQEIVLKYKYDRRGLMIEETNPEGHITVYTYDAHGQPASKTDADGYLTRFEHDALDNLTKVVYQDGKTAEFFHNPLNQLTGMQDWLGESRFELDPLGRIQKVVDYQNQVIEYTWNKRGEKTAIKYPDGNQVSYEYDKSGRLAQVKDGSNKPTAYKYDLLGNLLETLLPNGLKTVCAYDALSRLTRLTDYSETGKIMSDSSFAYDAVGNTISADRKKDAPPLGGLRDETIGRSCYSYDALNRLVEVKKPTAAVEKYFYDSLGNRVRKEQWSNGMFTGVTDYRYSKDNRLLEIIGQNEVIGGYKAFGPVGLEYDRRGNLVQMTADGKPFAQYTFNPANNLSRAVNQFGVTTDYTYDGMNLRSGMQVEVPPVKQPGGLSSVVNHPEELRKELRGICGDLTQGIGFKTQYSYVNDITTPYNDVLLAFTSHNQETQRYIHGVGAVGLEIGKAAQTTTSGPNLVKRIVPAKADLAYFLHNELGSPSRLVDLQGKTRGYFSYDAFGRPVTPQTLPGEATFGRNIYSYTGYQQDFSTGLMFAQARYYMPETARFISIDPMLDGDNWYTYCFNNPFFYVDLDGMKGNPVAARLRNSGYVGGKAVNENAWSFLTFVGSRAAFIYMSGKPWEVAVAGSVLSWFAGKGVEKIPWVNKFAGLLIINGLTNIGTSAADNWMLATFFDNEEARDGLSLSLNNIVNGHAQSFIVGAAGGVIGVGLAKGGIVQKVVGRKFPGLAKGLTHDSVSGGTGGTWDALGGDAVKGGISTIGKLFGK